MILLIGIGNEYRHDDAAGLAAVRKIKKENLPDVRIVEVSGNETSLMDLWKDAQAVIVVDAVSSGALPGTVHIINVTEQPFPVNFFHHSTHAFSLADAIELARTLNQLPRQLFFYGIEGKDFSQGKGVSKEARKGIKEVARKVARTYKTKSGRRDNPL